MQKTCNHFFFSSWENIMIEQNVQTVKWLKLFWPEGGSVDSFEEVVITGIYVQNAMLTS